MNKKIVSIVAIAVVIIALGLVFGLRGKPTAVTPPTVTTEEEAILSNQINSLTDEELAAISTDTSDFATSSDSDISQDISLFMYQ
jgi:hypothetical protein